MNTIQLELNLNNESGSDLKLFTMQNQLDEMSDSMGKVRRKLFSEMGEMKKLYISLKNENEELKLKLRKMRNEKTEWVYTKEGYLFDVREHQEAFG